MRISGRAARIEPFYVMEVGKAAAELARVAAGSERPVIALNIGEPDSTAPPLVQEAALRAVRDGASQYTSALGLEALRERIAQWYSERFGIQVPARRIVVTAGASAALQLACMALFEAGDQVLMPDPCYPCNRHFVSAVDAQPVLLPTTAGGRFQLDAQMVEEHWNAATRGVLLASPSNPTGTSIDPAQLARIHALVREKGGVTLLDEIYLGLSHDAAFGQSGLALDDQVISVNSFSKYFCMTGWRLGWLVVPEVLVPVIERLAQNFYICPNVIAQHAALACFEPESIAEYERRRAGFKARRDWFIPQLQKLGFRVPVMPDGAFYAWADASEWFAPMGVADSWDFVFALLERAHVAVTPGRDFGRAGTERFVRFSTANSLENLERAVARLEALR
ncbi:MAG: pyridoxal phosphate-dependent aminotransferase [Lysobacteraceae bacterium]|nr:pyridoxal phosphate-dependent aminotransferase [Gammaproteobacteria bacterium]